MMGISDGFMFWLGKIAAELFTTVAVCVVFILIAFIWVIVDSKRKRRETRRRL